MRVKVTLFEGAAILIVPAAHFHSFCASCIGLVVNAGPGGAVRGRGGVPRPGCVGAAAVSRVRPRPAHAAPCIRASCLCTAYRTQHTRHHTVSITYYLHITSPKL